MFSINIKRSMVTVGVVAGLLAAAGPASAQGGGADFTRFAGPGPHNEVAVEGLKAGASEVLYETVTLAHERDPSHRPQASTVQGLAVIYDVPPAVVADAGKGDDTITQAREPAHTVTMLDYMGTP